MPFSKDKCFGIRQDTIIFKGVIFVPADFPTLAEVKVGWMYFAGANVTDNDVTKTNTGQSFLAGDEIIWNGTNWTLVGANALWGDNLTNLLPINPRNIDIATGKVYKINNENIFTRNNPELTTFDKSVFGAINELNSFYAKVHKDISYFLNAPATQTLTTSGAGDLAAKIATLVDNDILEIQTDASYSSVVIPGGVRFAIRVAEGYDVQMNTAQAITISNGVSNVFLSGFIHDSNPGGTPSKGSAICFEHEAIVKDLIIHNCHARNNVGSAILLSYHQSTGGDLYYTANLLSEFSERISIIDCDFNKASNEPVEGAAVLARGIKNLYVNNCYVNGQDISRCIMLQNVLDFFVLGNKINRAGGAGNGEGIKIDAIGSPTYSNSGFVIYNEVKRCIEGIDIDDVVSGIVYGNKAAYCVAEGISIDDSSKAIITGNITHNNYDGIRAELGAVVNLKNNLSFDNSNKNYRMDNGYVPDDSNSTDPIDAFDFETEFYYANSKEINTGFLAWTSGSDANTYTVDGTGFQIDRSGTGFIKGRKVNWVASLITPLKTPPLAANQTSYIYIDVTGSLGVSTTDSDALFENNIVLFECLYDGTNYVTVKENHPYNFQTRESRYFHNNAGTVIRSIGAIATRVATGTGASPDDRRIKTVGADTLEDHGLDTSIPETNPVVWEVYYTDGSGNWVRNVSNSALPMLYNNVGTPTTITSNQYSIYTIYVSKDDIESTTPKFFAVMNTAEYASLVLAEAAITNGVNSRATNELSDLELAQLGYAIVRNNVSGGYIQSIIVEKSTFNSKLIGGAVTGDHNILNSLQLAGIGVTWGHLNDQAQTIVGAKTFSSAPILSSLNVVGGIVQTDGTGLLSSSVTLPDGTLATTQTPGDNSTKLATTEFVTAAVVVENLFDRLQIRATPDVFVIQPHNLTDGIALNGFMPSNATPPSAVKYFQGLFDAGSSVPTHWQYLYSPNSTYPEYRWTGAISNGSFSNIYATLDNTGYNIGTLLFTGGKLSLAGGASGSNTDFVTITNKLYGSTGTENSIYFSQARIDALDVPQARISFGCANNWIADSNQDADFNMDLTINGALQKAFSLVPDPVYTSEHLFKIEGSLEVNTNSIRPVNISNGYLSSDNIFMTCGSLIFSVVSSCNIDQNLSTASDVTFNTANILGKLTVGGIIDPTALVLDPQASPPSAVDGAIYYDSVTDKFNFRENAAWETLIDTFVGLKDTPSSYTTTYALYRANATPNGIEESTTLLLEPLANAFGFQRGTSTLTVNATCQINQNLTSSGIPSWAGLNLTNAIPTNGLAITLATPSSTYETGIGVDNNNKFIYNTDAGGTGIYSADSIMLMLDSNNDTTTTAKLSVRANATTYAGGIEVFSVTENARVLLKSPASASGNFSLFTIDTTDLDDQSALHFSKAGVRQWQLGSRNELDVTDPHNRLSIINAASSEVFTILQGGNLGVSVKNPSSRLDVNGDVEVGSTDAYYFGDPTTDTAWRIVRSGNDLVIQRRESTSWVTKDTIAA